MSDRSLSLEPVKLERKTSDQQEEKQSTQLHLHRKTTQVLCKYKPKMLKSDISPDGNYLVLSKEYQEEGKGRVPCVDLYDLNDNHKICTLPLYAEIKGLHFFSKDSFICITPDDATHDKIKVYKIKQPSWCCGLVEMEAVEDPYADHTLKIQKDTQVAVIGNQTMAYWECVDRKTEKTDSKRSDKDKESKETATIKIILKLLSRGYFDPYKEFKIEADAVLQVHLDAQNRVIAIAELEGKKRLVCCNTADGSVKDIACEIGDCKQFVLMQNVLIGCKEKLLFACSTEDGKPFEIETPAGLDSEKLCLQVVGDHLLLTDDKNLYFFRRAEQGFQLQRSDPLNSSSRNNTFGYRAKVVEQQLFITYGFSESGRDSGIASFCIRPYAWKIVSEKRPALLDRQASSGDISLLLQRASRASVVIHQPQVSVMSAPESRVVSPISPLRRISISQNPNYYPVGLMGSGDDAEPDSAADQVVAVAKSDSPRAEPR